MSTTISLFTANNVVFTQMAAGPATVQLNQQVGFIKLAVANSTAPANTFANTWLYKPVAGENYLSIDLDSGDYLWGQSQRDVLTITSIMSTPLASDSPASAATTVTGNNTVNIAGGVTSALWVNDITTVNVAVVLEEQGAANTGTVFVVTGPGLLPVRAARVLSTGTTATSIIALY